MLQVRDLGFGDRLEQLLLLAEDHLGRRQFRGDIEAGRAARGTDLRVVLRGTAGVVIGDLDAELLFERLDGGAGDDLLELGTVAVHHQRIGGKRGDDKRRGEAAGDPQQTTP